MEIISGWVSLRGRIGDHLRVGDHVGVGSISGAAVQAKPPRPVLPIIGGAPGKKSSDLANEAKMELLS